jgi:uncharacterized coiled-coil protein SlyX
MLSGPAAHVDAQDSPRSVSELRRENEQLRIRIDELEAQLARSQEAIEQLLEQVQQLNERLGELQRQLEERPAASGSENPEQGQQTPAQTFAELPEEALFAAPESLLRFSQASYDENFGSVTPPFESNDARARYLRDVEAWSKALKRTQRSQVDWVVEVRRVLTDVQPLAIEYRAVNPQSRAPYSDRVFLLQIPSRYERRFREQTDTRYWRLRGVAGVSLNINPDRETMGFFDVRPFIGPFVEFGMDISVNSLLPAPEPEAEDQQNDNESDAEDPSDAGGS